MWNSFCIVGVFLISPGKPQPFRDESLGNFYTDFENDVNINEKFGLNSFNFDRADAENVIRANDVNALLSNDLADLTTESVMKLKEDARKASALRKRKKKKKHRNSDDYYSDDSEGRTTKLTWQQEWKNKLLSEMERNVNNTTPRGDVVNMVSARPWGVPCGDPDQYPPPWGSCLLPIECESEYRIYRGDHYCGRTEFVCCALQVSSFDVVHAFEPDLESDKESDEGKTEETSREIRKRERKAEKKRRKRMRKKRKKLMKKKVKKLMKDMQKKLKKISLNSTHELHMNQAKMQQQLKKQKEKIRKDRHEQQLMWDATMDKQEEKMMDDMEQKFSHMAAEFDGDAAPRKDKAKSTGLRKYIRNEPKSDSIEYLDHDVEYGLLYV